MWARPRRRANPGHREEKTREHTRDPSRVRPADRRRAEPGPGRRARHRGQQRHQHRPAPEGDRRRHLRPGLHEHGERQVGRHVHRRRPGHPALPRLRHRGPRRALLLHGGGLPADLRRAARVQGDPGGLGDQHPAPQHGARGPQAVLQRLPAGRAPHAGAVLLRVRAVHVLPGLPGPARSGAGPHLHRASAGQAAGAGLLRVQEVAGPAVHVPAQLAELRGELPPPVLRRAGRGIRHRPGRGQGPRPAAHAARGPRAERLHLDGAPGRLHPGQPVRLGVRRHQRPLSRCTVAPTRPC